MRTTERRRANAAGLRAAAVVVAVLGVACGEAAPGDRLAGFNPPVAQAGELQIWSPLVKAIPSGANVTYCSYLDQRVAAELDVVGFYGAQSVGGHHALLYVARQTKPVGTHECTEDDMLNVQYLAGVGADKALTSFEHLPDGLAFRLAAGSQLMMQTHWINATLHPIDGQAAINLRTAAPSPSRTPADLFSVVDTQFSVPAGQLGSSQSSCKVGQDINLFFLGGHEHKLGTHVRVDHVAGETATSLYDLDWQPEYEFNPPINIYGKVTPLVIHAGDALRITCDWDNTAGASDVLFPQEMCVTWGFYYPGRGEIDCVDGNWPNQ